jgi:hypothetical protein
LDSRKRRLVPDSFGGYSARTAVTGPLVSKHRNTGCAHCRPLLRNVKQRLYRGRCIHNDLLAGSIAQYNDKREEIMAVIREVDDATDRSEKTMAKYVDKFYDTISSERRVKSKLVKKCI